MCLEFDLAEFYLEFYATATVDDLKKELQTVEKELQESEEKVKQFACKFNCDYNGFSTHSYITDEDILVVDFIIIHEKCICQDCELMMDYGSPEEPILITRMICEYKKILENAIYCKQKNYDKLLDEELDKVINDIYKYSRYLDKCETNFQWSDEDTPSGLVNEMHENEEEKKCFECEQKFRAIKKKYGNKTTLVQPDSD